ncbi:unnamed protein product [Prunus armeniaca]|uniref:Proteasome endopeptidase complex n=1 Tax=Prunus armeniaca TaxID=36596 RepID=A0A6J5X2U4_PRUAR|nr:unnamed protein product [Prunus armeniaca]CAB4306415.1 unnamed protein product [Prunus armeniaca]
MGMANAYSMINQELQNSVSEKEYLEKTNQEFKGKGRDATNLVVICDDTILVGVNTRVTCGQRKGFILDEKAKKLFTISDNILAVIAGDNNQCTEMLTYVKERMKYPVEIHREPYAGIRLAAIEAWRYCNFVTKFDGRALIVGWEKKDESYHPLTYLVSTSELIEKSTPYEALVNGSGGQYAYFYYEVYKKGNNREEIFELMKRALLFAAIFDENSGGIIRVVELKPLGHYELYHQPVLNVLFYHYNDFATPLSNSLFSLWYNSDYEYTHELNERVHDVFTRKFSGYSHTVVVGANRNFIVRLVHFNCDVGKLYGDLEWYHKHLATQLRPRHLDDLTVHSEVRALPWIVFEEFGASHILFGIPGWKLVEVLCNV